MNVDYKERFVLFFRRHAVLIFTIVLFLALFLIGHFVKRSARVEYEHVLSQINSVNNQLEYDKITVDQKTEYVARSSVIDGLNKNRWSADDIIINEWIYPAFNFEGAEEYNQHRDLFVTRLGLADDFVKEIMPPYMPEIADVRDTFSELHDGMDINMRMSAFRSYVDSVDGDTYSYIAFVTCASTNAQGRSGTSNVIITYSITADGEVINFHAATPSLT